MAVPTAQFILTDIQGNTLGEVKGAQECSVGLPHLRLPNASFTVPLWHPRAEDALSQDTLLWVYRTDHVGVRRTTFAGPVVSVEENGSGEAQTVKVNAVGPMWRLMKRLIGTDKAGFALSERDLGLMMRDLVSAANGQGYTGISLGTHAASNNGVLAQVWLKSVGEQIAEIAASINGPEFEIAPVAQGTSQGGWPTLGNLNVAPMIGGVTREDAVFEYGTDRANVATYTRGRTLDGVMTRGFISVQGWPDGTTQDLRSAIRQAGIDARGLYEEVVGDGGITDDSLRDSLLAAHLDVRQGWRQIITFTPALNARPAFQTDYNVGDFVKGRAVIRGEVRFDAFFRVWGAILTYDENGNEQAEIELHPSEVGA